MSPLPYLPEGKSELPASRFVVFADSAHSVVRIDESSKTLSGISFTGSWETGSLNGDGMFEKTIRLLTIVYSSPVDTTMTIRVSGDGGVTWPEVRVAQLLATGSDGIKRTRVAFNTSGYDVRIRLELDTDEVVNLFELHPDLVVRGDYNVDQSSS